MRSIHSSHQSIAVKKEVELSKVASKRSTAGSQPPTKKNIKQKFTGEEDDIVCGRFPHMDTCACDVQCMEALNTIALFEVYNGIIMGPFQSAFKT